MVIKPQIEYEEGYPYYQAFYYANNKKLRNILINNLFTIYKSRVDLYNRIELSRKNFSKNNFKQIVIIKYNTPKFSKIIDIININE